MIKRRRIKTEEPVETESEDEEKSEGKGIVLVVNKGWRLEYDGLQFKVQKKRVVKSSGRVKWKSHAYCVGLDEAVWWLAKNQVYTIPGKYDLEASLIVLSSALDAIRSEIRETISKALDLVDGGVVLPLTRRKKKRVNNGNGHALGGGEDATTA